MKVDRIIEAIETALESAEMRLKWEQERTELAMQELVELKEEYKKLQQENATLKDNIRRLEQGLADY